MSKIAIIGAGISGLGAAHMLYPHHDITVFEKSDHIGGHARTRVIDYEGETIAVDTGFIVFNYRNYPHLSAMFKYLDVPVTKSLMTFGVSADDGALEWGAQNLNALFGQRQNIWRPQFWHLLIDVVRFNARAAAVVKKQPDLSLGQLLDTMRMSDWFRQYYLLPMGAAIWSCPLQTMLQFPADEFIRFFKSHGLLTITQQPQWYTVVGGSQVYVTELIEPFKDKIRLNQGITSITRNEDGVTLHVNGQSEHFDQVIFACAGDQILSMLSDASAEETKIFGVFETQRNVAYLHNDATLMPKHKACWSSWVYHTDQDAPQNVLSVTYWMNLLQPIHKYKNLFVTLNPLKEIGQRYLFDTHEFHHPVYNKTTIQAQKHVAPLQGQNNTWYCGAWLKDGFHEDGLSSAVDVCQKMGVMPPWA